MRSRLERLRRPAALALALVFGSSFAVPVSADTPQPLAKAAAGRAARANLSRAVAQDAPAGSSSSGSFLRSGKGVAVVVLFVGGLAYAIHSRSNDRVHSQIR